MFVGHGTTPPCLYPASGSDQLSCELPVMTMMTTAELTEVMMAGRVDERALSYPRIEGRCRLE